MMATPSVAGGKSGGFKSKMQSPSRISTNKSHQPMSSMKRKNLGGGLIDAVQEVDSSSESDESFETVPV